jgi:hypothetical protein
MPAHEATPVSQTTPQDRIEDANSHFTRTKADLRNAQEAHDAASDRRLKAHREELLDSAIRFSGEARLVDRYHPGDCHYASTGAEHYGSKIQLEDAEADVLQVRDASDGELEASVVINKPPSLKNFGAHVLLDSVTWELLPENPVSPPETI